MADSRSRGHSTKPPPRGFTLLEIVVSLCLVALSLVLIVGIVPMNVTSLKKSEALQAATLYASEVLVQAESPAFVPDAEHLSLDHPVVINQVTYRVVRQIYGVDGANPPHLYDVVVHVSWEPQPVPVELRTRVYHP